jgi:peptidoglycan/xylan/chitin deacetylase (PgdA/CDA1 family)
MPSVKRCLYGSGALDAWHRHRTRHHLTVIGLHRVLPRSDPRYATSDPEYTLPLDIFDHCLEFFDRHYHVVSLDDVLLARRGARRLPPRPLLLTFDDGWRDNVEYAIPRLRTAHMPAAMFVAGAVLVHDTPFWQEQLVASWRSGRLAPAPRRALGRAARPDDATAFGSDPLTPIRILIAALEAVPPTTRNALLGREPLLREPRSMIARDDLHALAAAGIAIGSHGFSHAPLTRVDAAAEFAATRALLRASLHPDADAPALAFPHGKFDGATVARARELGFELLFTSVRELVPATASGPGLIGRIGITAAAIADDWVGFRPDLLALQLFRAPHAR